MRRIWSWPSTSGTSRSTRFSDSDAAPAVTTSKYGPKASYISYGAS